MSSSIEHLLLLRLLDGGGDKGTDEHQHAADDDKLEATSHLGDYAQRGRPDSSRDVDRVIHPDCPGDDASDRENPQSLLLSHSNPAETKGKIPLYLTLQYSM
jgi:hypothetical protein